MLIVLRPPCSAFSTPTGEPECSSFGRSVQNKRKPGNLRLLPVSSLLLLALSADSPIFVARSSFKLFFDVEFDDGSASSSVCFTVPYGTVPYRTEY